MPVPKGRTDDAYFTPLDNLRLHPETKLYLGLVHYDDAAGDAARIAAARRHARVDGVATECGMTRGDPERLPSLLAAQVQAARVRQQFDCRPQLIDQRIAVANFLPLFDARQSVP